MEHPSPTTEQTSTFSILLICIAFLSRAAQLLIDNYDSIFKILSVMSLLLVCAVNMGKLIEQLANAYDKIKEVISSRIKKKK